MAERVGRQTAGVVPLADRQLHDSKLQKAVVPGQVARMTANAPKPDVQVRLAASENRTLFNVPSFGLVCQLRAVRFLGDSKVKLA
ncbi:hypothetical protein CVN68_02280 [Sphingomonas psychrotolerans]|uniref:Uncharacterized protein n=1 Tax=Sphingomonas psychrotolerans TaxID=1327635 RepID=A0A2K8MAP4_9SPHN|nr:hypothetical protein CVN68_02280 [Sphingomonas psychrotolerans]